MLCCAVRCSLPAGASALSALRGPAAVPAGLTAATPLQQHDRQRDRPAGQDTVSGTWLLPDKAASSVSALSPLQALSSWQQSVPSSAGF